MQNLEPQKKLIPREKKLINRLNQKNTTVEYSKTQPQSNPIITGYFPQKQQTYKEMAISRVNRFLTSLLLLSLLLTGAAYYFVAKSEMKLNALAKETMALNLENSEMQIQLDKLQSYYNVDKTVKSTNLLHKAQQVIEVPAANLPVIDYKNPQDKFKIKWSMGF